MVAPKLTLSGGDADCVFVYNGVTSLEPFACSLKGQKASLDCTKPDVNNAVVCSCIDALGVTGLDEDTRKKLEDEKIEIEFWVWVSLVFGAIAVGGFAIFLLLEICEWLIDFTWNKDWKCTETESESFLWRNFVHWGNRKLMNLHSFV